MQQGQDGTSTIRCRLTFGLGVLLAISQHVPALEIVLLVSGETRLHLAIFRRFLASSLQSRPLGRGATRNRPVCSPVARLGQGSTNCRDCTAHWHCLARRLCDASERPARRLSGRLAPCDTYLR